MDVLNKKSGVLGISGYTSDFMDLERDSLAEKPEALLTMKVFAYRVAKYIGAYTAAMNGVDAIAFTAVWVRITNMSVKTSVLIWAIWV